jgi:hypothetical protein
MVGVADRLMAGDSGAGRQIGSSIRPIRVRDERDPASKSVRSSCGHPDTEKGTRAPRRRPQ